VCRACRNEKIKEIDKTILGGRASITALSVKYDLPVWVLKEHRKRHLPWRNPKAKPPETVTEKLADLGLELKRLQVLAECGEHVAEALSVVRERRQMLELEARMEGRLDATHRKLLLKDRPVEGNYRVEFVNGKPRTVAVKGADEQ
jgi:hypothetical protein